MKTPLIALLLCLTPIYAQYTGFVIDHTATDLSAIRDT